VGVAVKVGVMVGVLVSVGVEVDVLVSVGVAVGVLEGLAVGCCVPAPGSCSPVTMYAAYDHDA
jgi:hypothetical protein